MDNITKDILIKSVENYPCLYKTNRKSNKDLIMKENCWKEIAKSMYGVTDTEVTQSMAWWKI